MFPVEDRLASGADATNTAQLDEMSSAETSRLFELGNYFAVATHGSSTTWQKYAALGLIAKTQEALNGLSKFECAEAKFYRGVAHWISGADQAAIFELQLCDLPQAQSLLRLVLKPKIRVLAQQSRKFPITDPKFEIDTFGFDDSSRAGPPYASIRNYYDPSDPPDFYACFVVEQREIPQDIQTVPFPTFGVTSDYDLHIQTIVPWLKALDHIVVAGPQEWQDVSRLTSGSVYTFPKLYGHNPISRPVVAPEKRTADLFLSGTIIHPYNPDKFELINAAISMPGLKLNLIDGFVDEVDYLEALSQAKVTFCFVRRPDEMPTRGLEALAMGVATVVQADSVLARYFSEDEGLFVYRDVHDLPATIRRILSNWQKLSENVINGSIRVRAEFAADRTYSQYLRFLTVLASKPQAQRRILPAEELSCKEIFCFRGYCIPIGYREYRRGLNMQWWSQLFTKNPSARLVNDMIRELAIEATLQNYLPAALARPGTMRSANTLPELWKLCEAAVMTFPTHLVPRFNFARCLLHFGDESRVLQGIDLISQTLAFEDRDLKVDFFEDVFPWDFFSQMFNYRSYFDTIFKALIGTYTGDAQAELKRLIRASLHCYLGYFLDAEHNFASAAKLDPQHSFYRVSLGLALAQSPDPHDIAKSAPILEDLLCNSMYFREVAGTLERLYQAGFCSGTHTQQHLQHARRLAESLRKSHYVETFYPPALQARPPGIQLSARFKPNGAS